MGYRVIRFESTPNPNALKCVVEPSPGREPRSYFRAEQADEAGDELARALFALGPVTNVLIHTAFITVGKAPSAGWAALKPRIESALAGVT